MCNNLKEYKLCTCADNIDKTKPYWILYKAITNNSEFIIPEVTGELIIMPDFEITKQKLLLDLNSKNIFDFNHQPLENDILKIVNVNDTYYFLYEKNKLNYMWISIQDGFNRDLEKFSLFRKKIGFIEGDLQIAL